MRIVLILLFFSFVGCATGSKKEYQWVGPSGNVATAEELANIKEDCNYDNEMQKAKDKLGDAISVGRYENNGNTHTSDTLVKEASSIINEVKSCMKEKGYVSKEKQS